MDKSNIIGKVQEENESGNTMSYTSSHCDRNDDSDDEDDAVLDMVDEDEYDEENTNTATSASTPKDNVVTIAINNDETMEPENEEETATFTLPKEEEEITMRRTMAEKKEEAPWKEIWNDSVELENLMFSIQRQSARTRMLQLIAGLKLLSEKLQRLDEVQQGMDRQKQAEEEKKNPKRPAVTTETNNGNNTMDPPLSKKKPRLLEEDAKELVSYSELAKTRLEEDSSPRKVKVEEVEVVEEDLSSAPTLKAKNKWVQQHCTSQSATQLLPSNNNSNNVHCPDFQEDHTCPLGPSCTRWHIYNPSSVKEILYTRDDLDSVYLEYRNVHLRGPNFAEKIKPDGFKRPRYACCFICPLDCTIYYSNGIGPRSQKSSQNIWWYFTMSDARDAIATIAISHLIQRGIVPQTFRRKKHTVDPREETKRAIVTQRAVMATSSHNDTEPLPSILPLINPWNWMEIHYKHGRCSNFNSPNGCPNGRTCSLAHVHYPTSLPPTPSSTISLPNLVSQSYYTHFRYRVSCLEHVHAQKLSSLRIHSAMDNKNQTWYTAAWQCPVEHTIYYAAGGDGRIQTIQNMFLYPTKAVAKLALWNILLQSWNQRGLETGVNSNEAVPPSVDPRRSFFQNLNTEDTNNNHHTDKNRNEDKPLQSLHCIDKKEETNTSRIHTLIKEETLEDMPENNNKKGSFPINGKMQVDIVIKRESNETATTMNSSEQTVVDPSFDESITDISESLFGKDDSVQKDVKTEMNHFPLVPDTQHEDEDDNLEDELFGNDSSNDKAQPNIEEASLTLIPHKDMPEDNTISNISSAQRHKGDLPVSPANWFFDYSQGQC